MLVKHLTNEGSAFIWVLIIAAVMMVLGMSYATLAHNELAMAGNQSQEIDAFYVAQAGLEWGKYYISDLENRASIINDHRKNLLLYPEGDFEELGHGRVEVVLTKESGRSWEIESRGYINNASYTARQVVSLVAEKHEKLIDFSQALLLGSSPKDNDTPRVVHGDIVIDDNDVNDTILDNFKALEKLIRNNTPEDNIFEGDISAQSSFWHNFHDPDLQPQLYYIDGDVYLPTFFSGPGVIYSTGNIYLRPDNNVYVEGGSNPNDKVYLFAKGNFDIKQLQNSGSGSEHSAFFNNVAIVVDGFVAKGLGRKKTIRINGSFATNSIDLAGLNENVIISHDQGLDGDNWILEVIAPLEFGLWEGR